MRPRFLHSRKSTIVVCACIYALVSAMAACDSGAPVGTVDPSTDASPQPTDASPQPTDDAGVHADGSTVDATSPDTGKTNEAEVAWLGFEGAFVRALNLAFDGFNAATSATIPTQTASGDNDGSLTVTGDVDQGAASTKTMKLEAALAAYSDNGTLTYDTGAEAPATLDMTLTDIPTGTMSGTLVGAYQASGAFGGSVSFNLTFAGPIQPNAMDSSKVERKLGATHVAGKVTIGAATYTVDVVR
jgi:hypothetical protein